MKRYDHNSYSMDEKADGDWVEYHEAKKHVEVLQTALRKLSRAVGTYDAAVTQRDVRIAELEAALAQRDCRIARLEHELKYALGVAALHGPAQERVAELEDQLAGLTDEVESWVNVWRDERELLNTIGRQLGGQIPEQLVSEVARERMAEIADLIHPHDLAAYRAKKSLHK